DLILAVSCIVAKVDIDHSPVLHCAKKAAGKAFDFLVLLAHPQASDSGIGRALSYLSARKANQALRILIEVAVKHPHRVLAARYEFLHDEGAGGVLIHGAA